MLTKSSIWKRPNQASASGNKIFDWNEQTFSAPIRLTKIANWNCINWIAILLKSVTSCRLVLPFRSSCILVGWSSPNYWASRGPQSPSRVECIQGQSSNWRSHMAPESLPTRFQTPWPDILIIVFVLVISQIAEKLHKCAQYQNLGLLLISANFARSQLRLS